MRKRLSDTLRDLADMVDMLTAERDALAKQNAFFHEELDRAPLPPRNTLIGRATLFHANWHGRRKPMPEDERFAEKLVEALLK